MQVATSALFLINILLPRALLWADIFCPFGALLVKLVPFGSVLNRSPEGGLKAGGKPDFSLLSFKAERGSPFTRAIKQVMSDVADRLHACLIRSNCRVS